MDIKLTGDALKLFEDFIKYGELDPDAVASAMMYDVDGFKQRLRALKRAVEEAEDQALAL